MECVGHSFAIVALFVFLKDVWIRTQRAAIASRRATKLVAHLNFLRWNLVEEGSVLGSPL
jgi:hypothetical protein